MIEYQVRLLWYEQGTNKGQGSHAGRSPFFYLWMILSLTPLDFLLEKTEIDIPWKEIKGSGILYGLKRKIVEGSATQFE